MSPIWWCLQKQLLLSCAVLELRPSHSLNEMVSTADTEISLHIQSPWFRGGGGWCEIDQIWTQRKKLEFEFAGGGVMWNRSDLNSEEKVRVWISGGGEWCKIGQIWTQRKKFEFRGGGWCGTKFHFRGEVRILVKNFWKPSLPLHHR